MDNVRFEELVPAVLLEKQHEKPMAFIPVGSMEWHGPHMGMGMDTRNAYAVAIETAQRIGGVVLPPLYIGTEALRSPDLLRRVGFTGQETVIGMDFPENTVPSMYWPEQLFEAIIRQQVEMLYHMGYRLIAIINGHGADNQMGTLHRIAADFRQANGPVVVPIMVLFESCGVGIGHAGLAETAIMQHICPNSVELARLPQKPEKLRNVDYAIVDNETFAKGANEDHTVRYDPRDATPELGEKLVSYAVAQCVRIVGDALRDCTCGSAAAQ